MGDLASRLRRYAAMPPRVLLGKVMRRAKRGMGRRAEWLLGERCGTYARAFGATALRRHVARFPVEAVIAHAHPLIALCEQHLEHRFDLLGSGWVRVAHGVECPGIEGHRYAAPVAPDPTSAPANRVNRSNARESSRIAALIEGPYRMIDWQLDFRSGHRWQEGVRYADVPIPADRPGADIKLPWELARCQHLPRLALVHGLAASGAAVPRPAAEYAREFRNEVLDFMAGNPPGYGVNWTCAMDVGIRIANWLLARDLFLAAGARFDAGFEALLARSTFEHGRHIARNLEWNDEQRSNHYLADLCGLLYAGAYLPPSRVADGWIRFAATELAAELPLQFNPDGSCYETSTCYHRLSAEMIAWSAALLLSVPGNRLPLPWKARRRPPSGRLVRCDALSDLLPDASIDRIARMAEFTAHVTRPDGRVVQIGDNDSGRFFRLQPAAPLPPPARYGEGHGPTEDSLDHRHLPGVIGALLGRPDLIALAGTDPLDAAIVRELAGQRTLRAPPPRTPAPPAASLRIGSDDGCRATLARLGDASAGRSQCYRFALPGVATAEPMTLLGYPDFGLYVFRSPVLFLAVRCGPSQPLGSGAHAHNDQLSVELAIDGHDIARDPGSYSYTALPERRNEYRSAAAHFVPRIGAGEPCALRQPFVLEGYGGGRCLYFGELGFVGAYDGYGETLHRVVRFEPDAVVIEDFGERTRPDRCRFEGPAGRATFRSVPFSPGYGLREAAGSI